MRKFLLIEYWMEGSTPSIKKTVLTYDALLKRITDEHYSEGTCLSFAVIPADDDGNFGDTSKFEDAILH